jgi:ubiquitin related modifier 1
MSINITLEFSGGLDVLFDGKNECAVELPLANSAAEEKCSTVQRLLEWILGNLLAKSDRSDMLIQRGTVRPGVLVLVNQTDWEILGGVSLIINKV